MRRREEERVGGECGRGVWKTLRERGRSRERRHGGRPGQAGVSGEGPGHSVGHPPRLAHPPRSARPPSLPTAGTMVDRGPLLTSAIIFYLSIGAAIFEVLEEPHWRSAADNYKRQKTELLKQFPCLGQEGLDRILQVQWAPPGRGPGLGPGVPAAATAAGAAGRPGAENPAPVGWRAEEPAGTGHSPTVSVPSQSPVPKSCPSSGSVGKPLNRS